MISPMQPNWAGKSATGALAIGSARKHHRIPHNKGQAIPAFDPRPFKATGITYCSSAMGADHTAGLVFDQDLTEAEAVRRSQELQIINAVGDSTGFCIFLGPTLEETARYLSPFFGEEITAQQLADIGWQCLADEWQFNDGARVYAQRRRRPGLYPGRRHRTGSIHGV